MTSSRPYLIRSLYEWLNDNAFTPYILVDTRWPEVYVPKDYIQDDKIVLNICPSAIHQLQITNQELEFHASFSGRSLHICVPIHAVMAIYAKENSMAGMVFGDEPGGDTPPTVELKQDKTQSSASKKPHLKVVK